MGKKIQSSPPDFRFIYTCVWSICCRNCENEKKGSHEKNAVGRPINVVPGPGTSGITLTSDIPSESSRGIPQVTWKGKRWWSSARENGLKPELYCNVRGT